jgi:hypothetical protein
VLVGVLFGLAPAVEAAGIDVLEALHGRQLSQPPIWRHRSILVIGEAALAACCWSAPG